MSKLLKINFLSSLFMVSLCLLIFADCKKEVVVNVALDGAYKGTWILSGVTTSNAIVTIASGLSTPIGTFNLSGRTEGPTQSTATIEYNNSTTRVGNVAVSSTGNCSFTGVSNSVSFSFSGTRQ
jgi:hypothetical protein